MFKTLKLVAMLLLRRERIGSAWVLAVLALASLAEMLGIASVMPFLTALSEPEALSQNGSMSIIGHYLAIGNQADNITTLGLVTLGAIVFAAVVRTLAVLAINHYSQKLRMNIGNRALDKLLHQPYFFYSTKNSSELSKKILYDIDQLTNLFFIPFARVVAQTFTAVAVLSLMVFINPFATLTAFFFIVLIYASVYLMTSRIVHILSYQASEANSERFKIVAEAFGGIRELKVFAAEAWFRSAFKSPSAVLTRNQSINATLSEAPRFLIETIAFSGIIVWVILVVHFSGLEGGALAETIPTIGIMVFAGYRILPAAQQIYQGLNAIKFSKPFVQSVYEIIMLDVKTVEMPTDGGGLENLRSQIKLSEVSFHYDGDAGKGLQDFSLTIPAGSTIGFAGATGAGKTTLIDLILGLQFPQKGAIYFDDLRLSEVTLGRWRKLVSLVPQRIHFLDASIAQNVAFGCPADLIDRELVWHCLAVAKLDNEVGRLPYGCDTLIGEAGGKLSGGQLQRIGIARALYRRPSVLILDEATSALDNLTEDRILKSLAHCEPKMTIITIAHRVESLKACEMVYFMEDGQLLACGTFENLIENNQKFRNLVKETQ